MSFSFTPEQDELRREARQYLSDNYSADRVAELADSAEGWDPASWSELAEMGWLGVTVSEEEGGVGLGFVEQAILLEELGRVLYPGPYFATVALALPSLPPEERARAAAGECRWSGEMDGLVPDLASVDRVVTAEGAAPAVGEVLVTMDTTRRLGRLAPGPREPLPAALDLVRARAAAAIEAVGVASTGHELAVDYAKERTQFGRQIGVYQGVSHPLADSYAELELARSLAYWAAWCIDNEPDEASTAAAAANAFATETAVVAIERAMQVLGGIGMTWEHPLHRYYRRAQWLEAFAGFPAGQRAELATKLLEA